MCLPTYAVKYGCSAFINPYHAEFLKWNNPPSIFGTVHYHFKGYQDGKLKLVSQQYIEHGQTAWMCRLAWLYTGGKGYSLSVLAEDMG